MARAAIREVVDQYKAQERRRSHAREDSTSVWMGREWGVRDDDEQRGVDPDVDWRLDDARWSVRVAVRLHLSMCRHCRAFKRQLETLAKAARTLSVSLEAELPKDFEATLLESLNRKRSS